MDYHLVVMTHLILKFNNTNKDICNYIVDEMEINGIDRHVMNIPMPNNLVQNSISVDLNEYLLCFAEYDTDDCIW